MEFVSAYSDIPSMAGKEQSNYLAARGTLATGSSRCIGLCQSPGSGLRVDPGYMGPQIYTVRRIHFKRRLSVVGRFPNTGLEFIFVTLSPFAGSPMMNICLNHFSSYKIVLIRRKKHILLVQFQHVVSSYYELTCPL